MNIGSIFLLVVCLAGEATVHAISDEVAVQKMHKYRLSQKLLEHYERSFLPRLDESQPVKVQFFFQLINVRDVNAKHQFISVYGWVRQKWFNPLLQWNVSEFGGIQRITIDADRVWVPDVLLYNNWDIEDRMGGGKETFKTQVVLSSNGMNVWNSPAIFHSPCDVDITYFPFDVQKCKLTFGSWTLSSDDLRLEKENSSNPTKNYLKNGEWELISAGFSKSIETYTGGIFDDLTLTIEIGRNYYTYFINLVIPCGMISSMIFLSFLLPPDCGERISLGITVLLAMTVFQQLTYQIFPSFDFPLLGQYYMATSVEIALALVATTVILNFKFREATEMPGWLRSFLLGQLARLVGLKETIDKSYPTGKSPHHSQCKVQPEQRRQDRPAHDLENVLHAFHHDAIFNDAIAETDGSFDQNGHCRSLTAQMSEQHDANVNCENAVMFSGVLDKNERELSEEELELRRWEWNMAANVLDRFILGLSVVLGTVTFLSIFLQAPRVCSLFT